MMVLSPFIGAQTLTEMEPDSLYPGTQLSVLITGEDMQFTQASSTALYFGQDGEIDWDFYGWGTTAVSANNLFTKVVIPSEYYKGGTFDLFYISDFAEPIVLEDACTVYSLPIDAISPSSANQGEQLEVTIASQATNFEQGSYTVWFNQGSNTFYFDQGSSTVWFDQGSGTLSNIIATEITNALSEDMLNANFEIPLDAECGVYDVNMVSSSGDYFSQLGSFNISCEALVSGNVYYDSDNDANYDSNVDSPWQNALVLVEPGGVILTTDANGQFSANLGAGTYTFSLLNIYNGNYSVTSSESITVVIGPDNDDVTDVNFSIYPDEFVNDLQVTMTGDIPIAGFATNYWVNVKNVGSTVVNGVVNLDLDDLLTYESSSIEPSNIDDEDDIEWTFYNLPPNEEFNVNLMAEVAVEIFGTPLNSSVSVNLADDLIEANPEDNYYPLNQEIVSSYDPNDKLITKNEAFEEDYVLLGEELEYTIRFQNTGNYQAFNVRLEDPIDPSLDLSTIETVGSSHPYEFEIRDDGVVVWYFNNINLPDSLSNEPESHGFVKYRIRPLENVEVNTEVKNTAYIYFDFNPAVVTNTVETTYTDVLPGIIQQEPNRLYDVSRAVPNPFTESTEIRLDFDDPSIKMLKIFDASGKVLKTIDIQGDKTIKIDREGLDNGIYFYEIVGDSRIFGKIVLI